MITIPAISREWISTLIVAEDDPTGLTVRFAFKTGGEKPTDADWKPGEWADTPADQQPDGRYQARARIRVGPSTTLQLSAGAYDAWVRVVEAEPNGPTRPFDKLTIT